MARESVFQPVCWARARVASVQGLVPGSDQQVSAVRGGCRCLSGIHQAVEPQVRFQTVILLNHRGEDNIPIRQLKRVVRPALIGRT